MNITMITIGSTGDVQPYVLLGKELKKRGHRITIATFGKFADLIENSGLSFFSLSGDAEKMMNTVMEADSIGMKYLPRLEKSLRSVAPALLQDIYDSCCTADAMICNFFGSVYYSVAEDRRIPCVQTQYFPMDPTGDFPVSSFPFQHLGHRMNLASYHVAYLLIGMFEKRYLSEWRKSNDLAERKVRNAPDYRIGDHTVPVIYAISPKVIPRPQDWGPHIHMSGYWFDPEPVEWIPPEDLVCFLENKPTPVYIGFGSMTSGNMTKLYVAVLKTIRALKIRAVINLGWTDKKMHSTKNLYFTNYIPHDWIFPRVQAVIHHGGAGTTAAGLKHGKPTLVIPFGGDQAFWGDRIYQLKCGPRPVSRHHLKLSQLIKAIVKLLNNPEYRANAEALSRELAAEEGLMTAADLVEEEIKNW